MNISYNWLKELIDVAMPPDKLAQRLTDVGLAVEGVHPHADDYVLDIDLTSNRPDCLSHLGVAREIRVITNGELRIANVEDQRPKTKDQKLVSIQDPDLCHRFTARIVRNVKVGPSPKWLTDRLESIGERSINNVADITNYVMHELGQPMHAFDLDKLAGNRIVVRRARAGEGMMTLKEVECELDETVLAIYDAEKPVAIGGVIGGLDSSITDETVNVLLEVAYFKRESIRATSRKLNLATEASYRFERGVDIENLIRASNRATELIAELAGGEVAEFVDVYPTKQTPIEVESKDIAAATRRLTGLDVDAAECDRILTALRIDKKTDTIYTPPTWRHDIAIEEDLVEEVARHVGYDKIADELPPAFGAGEYQHTEHREKALRQRLSDLGFDEAMTYSFIGTDTDGMFETVPGLDADRQGFVTLENSVIEGAVRMRPTLIPGLLDSVRHNLNHQRRDIKLFETGRAFAAGGDEFGLPTERELLALAITGGETFEGQAAAKRELDFYDAKGAVEAALEAAGVPRTTLETASIRHLRNGQSASVLLDGARIGSIGRIADEIVSKYKFKQPVFVAELDLTAALAAPTSVTAYRPLPRFPAIVRDVTFAAPRDVPYESIRNAIEDLAGELCRDVRFVDLYEGKGLTAAERAITLRLEYRSDERTLLDEEVDPVHETVVTEAEKRLGIKRR